MSSSTSSTSTSSTATSTTSTTEPRPEFKTEVYYPDKLTRGEEFEVKAGVTNQGGLAKAVRVSIYFDGKNQGTNNCGDLNQTETCWFNLTLSSKATSLGRNEIGVEIKYV